MQTTAPSLEQGTHVLEAAGAVPTPVPPIGAATLEGAAEAAAVFVTTRVVKDVGAAAVEDAPGANATPGLEVAAGVETALVAAGALAAAEEGGKWKGSALFIAKQPTALLSPVRSVNDG